MRLRLVGKSESGHEATVPLLVSVEMSYQEARALSEWLDMVVTEPPTMPRTEV